MFHWNLDGAAPLLSTLSVPRSCYLKTRQGSPVDNRPYRTSSTTLSYTMQNWDKILNGAVKQEQDLKWDKAVLTWTIFRMGGTVTVI